MNSAEYSLNTPLSNNSYCFCTKWDLNRVLIMRFWRDLVFYLVKFSALLRSSEKRYGRESLMYYFVDRASHFSSPLRPTTTKKKR
jgi:hypothetical protein